jgi:DNA-binding NarL/FixJ family response regulator
MENKLRVVVADEQSDVRYALRVLLQLARELNAEVVGETAEAELLVAQLETLNPDLLLLDWKLPGLRSVAHLRSLYPQARLIVLSVREEVRQSALDAGADAFVCKGDPVESLVTAIRQVRSIQRGPLSTQNPTHP